jgi:CubicO group peptidase (beta-lactamase class C family)
MTRRAVVAALVLALAAAIAGLGSIGAASAADDPVAAVVADYRTRIPKLMAQEGIPGLAVALVGRDRPLWVQGFGHVDGGDSPSVDAHTIFSVQSMSKLFTATAVMREVAAGRLDLDTPITTYLPGFTVHSAFEEHPERKITLRMLLSHTAGFPHEAPIGNNNDLRPGSFDAHVRSISETWLRFPVGSGYAYSNLGIDLAGYILERVEGRPFAQVMSASLLAPLGMRDSTFDRAAIRARTDRAVGHLHPYPQLPVDVPMTAAGGLYASATDLARFLRFQLDGGSIDGRVVLGSKWLHEMQEVPSGADAGYALGVVRHRWNRWEQRPDLFEHGGGGFGFLSDLWWLPQVGIGVAILTNSQDHDLQNVLALSILTDLVGAPGVYRDRLLALPSRSPADDPDLSYAPPAGMARLAAAAAMAPTGDEAARWASYAGAYRQPAWGYISPTGSPDRFVVRGSVPYFDARDSEDEPLVRHRLAEVEPGLFLADDGETLDLRGRAPTWRNLRLVRVSGGPAAWQWTILAAAALIALAWLAVAPVRAVRRPRGSRPSASGGTWRVRGATAIAIATALATLATVVLLASMPGLVDSGYLGGLDLSLPAWLGVHLPLAVTVLGASTVVLAASGRIGRWWSSAVTLEYGVLAVATTALVVLLAGWHLIA